MNIQQIFGNNVKVIREAKGLSQEKFAEMSGFHRTYISGIERGKRNPTITVAHRLADALDVNLTSLFKKKKMKK